MIAQAREALPDLPSQRTVAGVNWAEAFALAPDEPQWVIPGLIEAGSNVSFVGGAKVGKSLFAQEMVAARSAGRPFLGDEAPAGVTMYLDYENRPDAVVGRFRTMGFSRSELVDLRYFTSPAIPPLDGAEGGRWVSETSASLGADLVVVDTLQRVITGDEESSTGIRNFYRHTVGPLRSQGIAVLRLDHLGKDVFRGARGSSAKRDDVDVEYRLSSKNGLLVLSPDAPLSI